MNYQLCYFHPQNAKGESMNLLRFGVSQFKETYLYQNQDKLKTLCDNLTSSPPKTEDIKGFAFNRLIDCIKIHICFENFIKGVFLANRFIVHEIDKNIFPELHKKQKNEPVKLEEILAISHWVENSKIQSENPELRKQIKGINKKTLGTNILTKKRYTDTIEKNEEIINTIFPYLQYRNNLHYYSKIVFPLSKSSYEDLQKTIAFVNNHIIRIHNMLIDDLQKGDMYKLSKI